MPSAQSSNRHPRIMTISPWSISLFSPKKRVVGSFLRKVNVGISYVPTLLAILTWTTTIDDGMHSWACPAVSPRGAGLACPVSIYKAKATPPTRAERGQEPTLRRRSHAAGSGSNYRRSRRRMRRRNPQPAIRTRALFKRPRRLRRLGDWAFPTLNHASTATDADDDDDIHPPKVDIPSTDTLLDETDDESEESYYVSDDNTELRTDDDAYDNEWTPNDDNDALTAPNTIPSLNTNKKAPRTTKSRQLDISSFTTQNAHGLRRRPRDNDGNIIANGPHDYTRYEHLITSMKTKNLDVYFVQETWLEDDVFDEVINGYHIFRHNGELGKHNFRGVAIILSPRYYEGWKAAGATPPITTDATGEFSGRYISLTVKLDSCDKRGKLVRGKNGDKSIILSLASIYHPCTKSGSDDVYMRFLETLDGLLDKLPKSELIIGADINANIGRFDSMSAADFGLALGPHGLPKRNPKGEGLLNMYLTHRLRVMNTFFPGKANGPGHGTWTSVRPTSNGRPDSHMLDVIVASTTLHKRIKNCFVAPDGIESDHRAVRMTLNLTSIKYKPKASMHSGEINWRAITEKDEQRKLYNKYLLELTSKNMTYENFCEAVVRVGRETAMSIENKCEGWYTASEAILTPAIEEKTYCYINCMTSTSLHLRRLR